MDNLVKKVTTAGFTSFYSDLQRRWGLGESDHANSKESFLLPGLAALPIINEERLLFSIS